jgi:hypothetical protein
LGHTFAIPQCTPTVGDRSAVARGSSALARRGLVVDDDDRVIVGAGRIAIRSATKIKLYIALENRKRTCCPWYSGSALGSPLAS